MTDRNLLLGVLALRMDFIPSAALLAAMDAWFLAKHRPLGQILVEQGALTSERLVRLEALIEERGRDDGDAAAGPDAASTIVLPIPRFSILRPHKPGGMGEVFVAHDQELKREVALKQIKDEYADHADFRALFIFEAEVTGKLDHPGIVPVYSLGRHSNGRPYYAMRFIPGETLRDAIQRFYQAEQANRDPGERALELRELLARFLVVCDTVAYAHSRGVLHRDLKPGNVMLGPYGETLVVDWGIAKSFDPEDAEASGRAPLRPASAEARSLSLIGQLKGTWAYMAPEQAAGLPDEVGPHTDIYGLGSILFEILTGQPPHARSRRTPDPPRAAALGGAAPPALDEIAARAMMPQPADRWPTATALGDAVRRWLADEPIAGHKALLAQLERLAADHPGEAEYKAELARHRVTLGLVLQGMGRRADAEAMFRTAVAEYERLASAYPAETRHRADLATTRVYLSRALRALGRAPEAGEVERAAVADYERLRDTNPHDYRTGLTSAIITLMPGVNVQPPAPAQDAGPAPETETLGSAAPQASVMSGDQAASAAPGESLGEVTLYPADPAAAPRGERTEEMRGRFTILRELARGGGGVLWVARDDDLNREVVIKQLHTSLSESARLRFVREAQIAAQLEHPNIAAVYGAGQWARDGEPFFIQRYVRGPSLAQAIRDYHDGKRTEKANTKGRRGLLDRLAPWGRRTGPDGARRAKLHRLLWAFLGACKGLAFAHSLGVLHRDPKPANIIVSDQVGGVLVDWGLAKVAGAAEPGGSIALTEWAEPHNTRADEIMGTPAYMAPEMAQGRQGAVDARSDVYVLGAALFELLTGRPPWRGATAMDVIAAIATTPAPRPRAVDASVPAALDAICARAMARKQEDRYPTARELGQDVERWLMLMGQGITAFPKGYQP